VTKATEVERVRHGRRLCPAPRPQRRRSTIVDDGSGQTVKVDVIELQRALQITRCWSHGVRKAALDTAIPFRQMATRGGQEGKPEPGGRNCFPVHAGAAPRSASRAGLSTTRRRPWPAVTSHRGGQAGRRDLGKKPDDLLTNKNNNT